MRVPIKPLSVNQAWQGRRYKTKQYKEYEKQVMRLLTPINIPEGPLQVSLTWGFSSSASDVDNPTKPFVDILQKRYGFNDNRIVMITARKVKVKRGDEFIEFQIAEAA